MPLPAELYTVSSIVELEQIAMDVLDIPADTLMQRAGTALFRLLQERYAGCRRITVLCGAGNNAGDGYVVARLASQAGFEVRVASLIERDRLRGAAARACDDWLQHGSIELVEDIETLSEVLLDTDVIVDAMLGTGLQRELDALWRSSIAAVNRSHASVIAVDIPSGLYADTGHASNGGAVKADITLTFIGLKQGLFTADAGDHCGEVLLDRLGLDDGVLSKVEPDASLLCGLPTAALQPRPSSSHKASFGHLLIAGGNSGMPGAVVLAARAALRCGAGRVTVVTHADNLAAVVAAVPEAMIRSCADEKDIDSVFEGEIGRTVSHVAIGPGLGTDRWGRAMLKHCLALSKPVVVDADALNILAAESVEQLPCSPLIMTPHPGEAARLLSSVGVNVDVQADRFSASRYLQAMFDADTTVVLKGYGSLVCDGIGISLCHAGNAAMSSAGMGDVLTGIIGGLMAQGVDNAGAARIGVCLHATTADRLSERRTRGLLASDITDHMMEMMP